MSVRISVPRLAVSAALCAGALFGLSTDAGAADAQHCLRGTSTALSAINSAGADGDETFFTVKPAPPNIMFVLDNSGSMNRLPIDPTTLGTASTSKPSDRGCGNSTLDAIIKAGGFKMTASWPAPDPGVDPVNFPDDKGFPNLFNQDKFYRYWGNTSWLANDVSGYTYDTSDAACANVAVKNDLGTNVANCKACLASAGYYLDPNNNAADRHIFTGKFLNFYPPKYVVARTVLKRVMWNLRSTRFGLTVFGDDTGGKLVSGMSPSCSQALVEEVPKSSTDPWAKNRRDRVLEVNGIVFNQNTPLAETLFNVGQYFTSNDSVYDGWFGTGWTKTGFTNPLLTQNRSVCWACQVNSVVLITDGAPNKDNCVPECVARLNVDCDGCNQMDGTCGGTCPSKCGTKTDCKNAGTSTCCSGTANRLDDVAKWLATRDLQTVPANGLSFDGRQRLVTYTVGFGINHPLLSNTATAGEGKYYVANDSTSLEASLVDAVADIGRRATSFGLSSVSTLQTATSGASTLVPRFMPGTDKAPWKGSLYRFDFVSEYLNGCKPTALDEPPDVNDLDQDHQCISMLYRDRDGDVTEEDPATGLFVKKNLGTLARPFWEAGRELTYDSPAYGDPETAKLRNTDTRTIWTVLDDKAPLGKIDANDTLIAFTSANADKLMPYLQISADVRADPVCTALADSMGVLDTARSTWGVECAKVVIEYYRGRKANDPDPAERGKTRSWLLGDIFHGSPVVVEPPVAPEACDFFRGQCLRSLFTYGGDPGGTTTGKAYRDYITGASGPCGNEPCERRRKIVLAGANDGLLHAFDYGAVASPESRDQITNRLDYNTGTGRELWAFIPPDLLGSLKHSLGKHAYFVDGTPMVRDVWVDGTGLDQGDGVKAASEFRTIAIVGERSGGTHFFALDVTESADKFSPSRPKFLWMWPQPCDPRAVDVGQSWSNFVPKPPPIVPVLLDASTTGYAKPFDFRYRSYDGGTKSWKDVTAQAQERWVVMLNGGYDKYLLRGRGVAMVDAWTGNTLWEAFHDPNATDLRASLQYPIPAGVALMDVGSGEPGKGAYMSFDGYFDTANFGDMGGSLWTARFFVPGKIRKTTGQVENWFLARSFQTQKADATMANRRPITYIAANAMQPNGYLRTFFGTGDRNTILSTNGGDCTLDNLNSCIAMGCEVFTQYQSKSDDGDAKRTRMKWKGGKVVESTSTKAPCVTPSCFAPRELACRTKCNGSVCAPTTLGANQEACLTAAERACAGSCPGGDVRTELTLSAEVTGCPTDTTQGDDRARRELQFSCDTASGQLQCSLVKYAMEEGRRTWKSTASLVKNRFFGVHSFGGENARIFEDANGAASFDAARLTETNLADLGSLSKPSSQIGDEAGKGWFLAYDSVDEKTGSAPGVSAGGINNERGCVLWNTLTPGSSGASGVCTSVGEQTARMVQADYLTGQPTCAASFEGARFQTRGVLVPPTEPTQVLILANGRLSYAMVSAEPGHPARVAVTGVETELVQGLYSLELSQSEHQCRHVPNASAACAP